MELSMLSIDAQASVKGNNGGDASIAFIELTAESNYDGHFVLYYHPGAQALARSFFGSLLGSGAPTIGPFDPLK
jgi:hypothetical protein